MTGDRPAASDVNAVIDAHERSGYRLAVGGVETNVRSTQILALGLIAHELLTRGFTIERQKPLPVRYRGEELDLGYRIDLLVENSVIVEVKSVERFHPIHGAQLVSYLRHSRCKVGLVLNFNVKWFVEDGIMRRVNGFPDE